MEIKHKNQIKISVMETIQEYNFNTCSLLESTIQIFNKKKK